MKTTVYYGLGRPFSPLYSMAMRIREQCYRTGMFRRTVVDVPVISVGNLTMGGTGKTPMVQYIARFLQHQGYQPAIISRGYGGATKERINIVSNGREVLLDAAYVGDEPRLLAETLPGVFVLTGVVRKLPVAKALKMGADVLLLDDGFQHLAIRRDLDLVLFNADTLAGNSRVFPGGDLREPVKALHRCHAFILTGSNEQNRERAEKFSRLLEERFPGRPVFFSGYRFAHLVQQNKEGNSARVVAPDVLEGQACYAFCGIARPEGFRSTLEQLAIEPVAFHPLPDHHVYRKNVVRQLAGQAERTGATCFLCTEKDLVKLSDVDLGLPLYAVSMKVDAEQDLTEFVLQFAGKQTH
ncbi:MAG: tetraacyldisaccharide 4'-kinase [Desulfocapsa sp.]|nr:MAG: tetraacyldisaccharide 4'-kinase [Desulfocapsa sp.]